jgi:hypothetical protein
MKFQIADSSRHENKAYDIDAEHRKFHEAIMERQKELADKAAPSVVTPAQVNFLISAFGDVRHNFYRCRSHEHGTERLCGTIRALHEGTVFKPEPTKDGLKELWLQQRKLAEHLLNEILKTGKTLQDLGPAVRSIVESQGMRLHQGTIGKAELKDDLQVLWGAVLKRVVAELWKFQ